MFTFFNLNGHKFANKQYYSIDEVMNAYLQFKQSKVPVTYKGITFQSRNNYLDWLLYIYNEQHEFRCSICHCKANHFRLINETCNTQVFHLFGINHFKGTNSAEYVFFNRDHIVPKSHHGSNIKCNMRLTCEHCNADRGNEITTINKQLYDESLKLQLANQYICFLSKAKPHFASEKHKCQINKLMKAIANNNYNIQQVLLEINS